MSNMSRSVRRQLLCIRLCEALRDSCAEAFDGTGTEMPSSFRLPLARLQRQEQAAFAFIHGGKVNAAGQMELDPKAMAAYGKSISGLMAELHERYEETLDARSFCALAMVWVERTRPGIPKTQVDRWLTWRTIAEILQEIKDLYPENEDATDEGVEIGDRAFDEVAA